MKRILVLLIVLSISFAQSQTKLNEQDALKKDHIDFNKQFVYFVIWDTVEIDGHDYWNPATKEIIWTATLDGVTIIDTLTKIEYTHRKCETPNCTKIHLVKKAQVTPDYRLWQTIPFNH